MSAPAADAATDDLSDSFQALSSAASIATSNPGLEDKVNIFKNDLYFTINRRYTYFFAISVRHNPKEVFIFYQDASLLATLSLPLSLNH